MEFIVEIKNKAEGTERKFKIFAPSKERAEEWGAKQAEAFKVDLTKIRVVATPVIVPTAPEAGPEEDAPVAPKESPPKEKAPKEKVARKRRKTPKEGAK